MKIGLMALGLIMAGSIAALAMSQAQDGTKTYSWRYKMTVTVETPEGEKSGSAVREVTVIFVPRHDPNPNNPQYDVGKKLKGEAVVVDLGKRGKVFAVQSHNDYSLPFRVFKGPPGLTIEGAEYYSQLMAQKELPISEYPMFVMFEDLNNPLSVQLAYGSEPTYKKEGNPYTLQNNFEKIFGQGVKLKKVQIEMTNEPLVYKIREALPWIDEYHNQYFDGKGIHTANFKNKLANRLGSGSFTTDKGVK